MSRAIRWGILGAASIARRQFLPGLREAGNGRAVMLGCRDLPRGEEYAAREGIERAVEGYEAVLQSGEIDAVYVALPNTHHEQWAVAALEAGLAVLCEKPLTHDVAATDRVLDVAQARHGSLLWEAFVFPFQAQHRRLVELIDGGAIGTPTEIVSHFHFTVSRPENIRLSAELGGGAVADVGCYPIRLAYELLGPADGRVCAQARAGPADGRVCAQAQAGGADADAEVELDAAGIVSHGAARLILSCGFRRPYDTFTRVIGDAGELRLTNPFHPEPGDVLEVHRSGGEPVTEHPTTDAHSFSAAIRHIHAVIRDEQRPRQLAIESAAATARTLAAVQQSIRR